MIIVGIHDTTQNYSMSVIFKQKIYSIELERLIGIKTGIYKNKITDIFYEQINLGESTYIKKDTMTIGDYGVYLMFKYFSDFLGFDKSEIDLLVISSGKQYKSIFGDTKTIFPQSHHLMHLYSTYFLSGFDKSNILIIDGAGYDLDEQKVELQSMYIGEGNQIHTLKKNIAQKHKNIGIGIAYERVSTFIGLTEGKLMGLSGYGQKYTRYNFFDLNNGEAYLKASLHPIFCDQEKFLNYYGILGEYEKNGYQSEKIIDFVYSFQKEIEEAILYLAKYLYEKNPCENLCYAGGVALNCLTNYRLKNELNYKNIFIQAAAGDSGISLGNLLFGYYSYLNEQEKIELADSNYGLGRDYKDNLEEILSNYDDYLVYEKIESEDKLLDTLAQKINSKNINIVFKGGSEFGPRALGNRSIIASVNITDLQYKVNKIKDRELWRPFGMMILKEYQEKYFENSVDSKHMLFTNILNQEGLKFFKNICHNDNSIRLQTIFEDNTFYYNLLNKLKYYGVKGILNTSLNGKGQPILETPKETIEFFLSKESIENLFIENYLVTKKTNKKLITKKLSNHTLINNVINNMKMIFIKKTRYTLENLFLDLDLFTKKISVSIITENQIIGKIDFLYENDKYILDQKTGKVDNDYSTLILNVVENTEFLNKLFGVLRATFIK